MTHVADKLSQEKIQQLLAAVGVCSQEEAGPDADAPDSQYAYHRPQAIVEHWCATRRTIRPVAH